VVSLAFVVALGPTGCEKVGPPPFKGPPVRVLCTTTIVADVIRNVGGDRVSIDVLMGAGVDPHRYLPTAGDRGKLESAHLVFFNGLHLEGKMADTFEKANDRIRAVPITRDISRDQLRPAEAGDGTQFDPHVWFDVRLWMKAVECADVELTAIDPD